MNQEAVFKANQPIQPTKMGLKYNPPTIAFSYYRKQKTMLKKRLYIVTLNGLINLPNSQIITEQLFQEHSVFLNDYDVDFAQVKHLIEILLSQIKWTQGEEVQSTYISQQIGESNVNNQINQNNVVKPQFPVQQQNNNYYSPVYQQQKDQDQQSQLIQQQMEEKYLQTPPLINRQSKRSNLLQNLNHQFLDTPQNKFNKKKQHHQNLDEGVVINEDDLLANEMADYQDEQDADENQNPNLRNDQHNINNYEDQQNQQFYTPVQKNGYFSKGFSQKKNDTYNISSLLQNQMVDYQTPNKIINQNQKNRGQAMGKQRGGATNAYFDQEQVFQNQSQYQENHPQQLNFENEFIEDQEQLFIGFPEGGSKNGKPRQKLNLNQNQVPNQIPIKKDSDDGFWFQNNNDQIQFQLQQQQNQAQNYQINQAGQSSPADRSFTGINNRKQRRRENHRAFMENEVFLGDQNQEIQIQEQYLNNQNNFNQQDFSQEDNVPINKRYYQPENQKGYNNQGTNKINQIEQKPLNSSNNSIPKRSKLGLGLLKDIKKERSLSNQKQDEMAINQQNMTQQQQNQNFKADDFQLIENSLEGNKNLNKNNQNQIISFKNNKQNFNQNRNQNIHYENDSDVEVENFD